LVIQVRIFKIYRALLRLLAWTNRFINKNLAGHFILLKWLHHILVAYKFLSLAIYRLSIIIPWFINPLVLNALMIWGSLIILIMAN